MPASTIGPGDASTMNPTVQYVLEGDDDSVGVLEVVGL